MLYAGLVRADLALYALWLSNKRLVTTTEAVSQTAELRLADLLLKHPPIVCGRHILNPHNLPNQSQEHYSFVKLNCNEIIVPRDQIGATCGQIG